MATYNLTDGQLQVILDGVSRSTKATQDLQKAVHDSNLAQSKITRAIAATDRCDGSTPHFTRIWLAAVDGYVEDFLNTDDLLDEFLRSSTHGSLLTSLRAWLKLSKKWVELRAQIIATYLSACDDLLLQRQLDNFIQDENEPIPQFTRRFHAAANNAYPPPRSADDEQKVKTAFLRSLNLPHLAMQLYQESVGKTLEEILDIANTKSAQHDKFMFMRLRPGEYPMDTSTASSLQQPPKSTKGKPNVDLDSKFDSLSGRLDRLATKIEKVKLTASHRPAAKLTNRQFDKRLTPHPRSRQSKFTNSPVCYLCGTMGHVKRNCYARFTRSGQPICMVCKASGHGTAACNRHAPGHKKPINYLTNRRVTPPRQTRAVTTSNINKPRQSRNLN